MEHCGLSCPPATRPSAFLGIYADGMKGTGHTIRINAKGRAARAHLDTFALIKNSTKHEGASESVGSVPSLCLRHCHTQASC